MEQKDGRGINGKVDEELVRQQIELSRTLFEMNPGMAKKVIVATNLEIARLENFRIKAEEKFKSGSVHMNVGRFSIAGEDFARVANLKMEIGDKNGEALALEMKAQCYFKSNVALSSAAHRDAEKALKIYQEIGDEEGAARARAMIEKIEQERSGWLK